MFSPGQFELVVPNLLTRPDQGSQNVERRGHDTGKGDRDDAASAKFYDRAKAVWITSVGVVTSQTAAPVGNVRPFIRTIPLPNSPNPPMPITATASEESQKSTGKP